MDAPANLELDLSYQTHILQGVSRTFALTIPQLPPPLSVVVSNAYLLCRIADTIEDEAGMSPERKRQFAEKFIGVLSGEVPAERFARELHPLLSNRALAAERDLVLNTPRVVRITRGFREPQIAALRQCVKIMSRGMAEFQQRRSLHGLHDLAHVDRYCYHVAGVVGEMLTELFCDYSPVIEGSRDDLLKLSVSFGQGLQMTNILKDIWEDRHRGACWLPRDVFQKRGFDLSALSPHRREPAFNQGLVELIGIAKPHLANALSYTLLIPRNETGIRRFCLWALGMAVLTLRKIHARLDFTSAAEVKIARRTVRATVLVTSLSANRDAVLRVLFDYFTRTLPHTEPRHEILPV